MVTEKSGPEQCSYWKQDGFECVRKSGCIDGHIDNIGLIIERFDNEYVNIDKVIVLIFII